MKRLSFRLFENWCIQPDISLAVPFPLLLLANCLRSIYTHLSKINGVRSRIELFLERNRKILCFSGISAQRWMLGNVHINIFFGSNPDLLQSAGLASALVAWIQRQTGSHGSNRNVE